MAIDAAAREDGSGESSSETRCPEGTSSKAQPVLGETLGVDGAPDSRSAQQSRANRVAEAAGSDVTAALPQVLKVVGTVVAPTTLLTALLFYFGRLDSAALLDYFGVQVTVLDLTFQDYLFRSADGLILPLFIVAAAALVTLWIYQLLHTAAIPTGVRRIVLPVLMPSAAIAGLVLVSLALADAFKTTVFPTSFPEARGLSLAIGALFLACTARLLRRLIVERRPSWVLPSTSGTVAVAEWGVIFILVSIGLFWAVGSYAIGVGIGRAQIIETSLSSWPEVTVYSEKRLNLQVPGVREVVCQDSDAAYRFRYDGLKLVQQSGNQYLFLPAGWIHATGTAILLPRRESLRLEFSMPGQIRSATC
jgi:hypothetical protein